MLGIELFKRLGGGAGGGGGSGSGVDLLAATVSGTTYAQWTIGSDGFTYKRLDSGAAHKSAAWINPQAGMNLYEVNATVSSGDTPDGTLGAWLNLGTSETWGWANELSAKSCSLLVQIRRVFDAVVVSSATVSIYIIGLD